jgi:hypothetical protein
MYYLSQKFPEHVNLAYQFTEVALELSTILQPTLDETRENVIWKRNILLENHATLIKDVFQ